MCQSWWTCREPKRVAKSQAPGGKKKGKTKERGASKEDTHTHPREQDWRVEDWELQKRETASKQSQRERQRQREREHPTEGKKERQLRERENSHTHTIFSAISSCLHGLWEELSAALKVSEVLFQVENTCLFLAAPRVVTLSFLSCCSSCSWIELNLVPSFNICNSSSSCQTSDSKENSLSWIKQSINQSINAAAAAAGL